MDSSLLFLFFTIFTTSIPTVEPKSNSYTISFPRSYRPSLIQTKEPRPNLPFKPHFFPQLLDHFTFLPQSYNIFYQKYLINSDYWDNGPTHRAPIFVYTGNEGDIEWFAANTGFMLEIAPKFHALLVFIEVLKERE